MSKSCSLSCKTQKCEVKLNQAETSFHPQKTWAMKTAGNSWTSHDGAGDTVLKSSFHYLYLLIPQRVTGAGVYPPLPWMRGHISSSLSQGWYSQPFRLTTAPPSGIYSEHPVWYTTMMIHTHTHTHTHSLTNWKPYQLKLSLLVFQVLYHRIWMCFSFLKTFQLSSKRLL